MTGVRKRSLIHRIYAVHYTLGRSMKSHCDHRFSYWYSFRVFNPWKHKCPKCGVALTGGKRAGITVAIALLIGAAVAAVAITMEHSHRWVVRDSLVWFAFAIPAVTLPYQYWCWKWVHFIEREDAA